MKKILIATSALAVMTASSAFALDVKTTGAVEYKYSKTSENSVGQNPKLSQGGANIKMAASGASSGMGYGAWVNIKSATSTTHKTSALGEDLYAGVRPTSGANDKNRYLGDFSKTLSESGKKAAVADTKATAAITANSERLQWRKIGYTQDGKAVYQQLLLSGKSGNNSKNDKISKSTNAKLDGTDGTAGVASALAADKYVISGYQVGGKQANDSGGTADVAAPTTQKTATKATSQSLANNAVTQSAFWVSGSWGKFVVGQSGSAAGDNAISGAVSAASFTTGTTVAAPSADQTQGERYTYTAPTIVDGLTVAYTSSFKGNVDTAKTSKAKASSNWAVKYSTDLMGVALSVAHASGTTSKTGDTKTITNTQTGMTAGYGNFTVGYGVFTNGKKAHQKKATSGSNYGVKYASGDWSVGYTVKNSEDTNKYTTHSNKSASTSAWSAKYNVASGFSVYASKSNNSVKSTNGTSKKNNYTIIGAKISF